MSEDRINPQGNEGEKATGKVEHVSAQPDGSLKREVEEVEVEQQPRTESGATGTWGEGDRTDKNSWLTAGMADDEQSRDPEGFYKESHTAFENRDEDKEGGKSKGD